MEKYFNENRKYEGPVLIEFDKGIKVKLCEMQKFLDSYKPILHNIFEDSYVWGYAEHEVGDYGNYCRMIYETVAIDPEYSRVFRESQGIYKAGETNFQKMKYIWYYEEGKPFWNKPLTKLYEEDSKGCKYIDEVEIQLDGVFVISHTDKQRIEERYN